VPTGSTRAPVPAGHTTGGPAHPSGHRTASPHPSPRTAHPSTRAHLIAHEFGHRVSDYRTEDRVHAQWGRPTVRMTAGLVSLVIIGLTVLAARVATRTALLLEVAGVCVGLVVIGSVLMYPLIGELHEAEFVADDYAAEHTGTAGTIESLTQLRSRFEPVTALVPFFNTHPTTTARIQRQQARAHRCSPPG